MRPPQDALRYGIIVGTLVPLVAGSCLPDAIPPAQRQNLVNANGETYPAGFFICNWAASYAAHILAATLVEEMLGFNTTLNLDAVGSGTVAGYYGITGCRTYNDPADRGCLQGVSYYHVGLEAWEGYPSDWDYIQKTYKSMAPVDLGSMGYSGPSGMYIPNQVQTQAYSTVGEPLEFYRTWNASWYQPQRFFGSIASFNKTDLVPCNDSNGVLGNDAAMKRHVYFTNDLDGVINTSGVYSGRCDDGFWWAAPACRSDTTTCIPFISSGSGWGVEDVMQKFTYHNMPVAVGVTASWAKYTTLPLPGDTSFYWWAPDPTFLELSPLFMIFAEHDPKGHAEGNYKTAATELAIRSIVSSDLIVLSPSIYRFADNLQLSMAQMDEMLLDQKNSGDSWENVTCRWLEANRQIWQKWIPVESACVSGFGLYDAVAQQYTDSRAAGTNKITCQACPPGKFSEKLNDNKGETYICVPCSKGTSQSSGASDSCTPCKEGEYQDEVQSTECKRCDFGTYQDQTGQTECKSCPASTSTLGFGSVAESDCGCPENYIDMNETGGFNCVQCGEGMVCPALSQLVDLVRGESANGEQFTPIIQPGFYSTQDAPTEVFLCASPALCPGGTPGSCAGGRVETPCAQCLAGETWTGSRCEHCGGWREVFAFLLVYTLLIFAYYLTTGKVTAKATVIFSTTASVGILVMSLQTLGLISLMTVEFPQHLQDLFAICKFFVLDLDDYGFSCIAGPSEAVRYMMSASIFPFGVALLSVSYGVSLGCPRRRRWQGPKMLSTAGAFLQVGYSTMSATALAPLMCYKHPIGLRSVLQYPGVVCGTAEHSVMLTMSILLLVFVLGFLALCFWAALKVPEWSSRRNFNRVESFKFLVFRFRLDSWWFGVPLLVRGTLLNLPVVLVTDHPPVQIIMIAMLMTAMLVMQLLAWPWKVPLLNVIDSLVSFCIVLMVTTSTLYLNKIDESMYGFASAVSSTMMACIGLAVFFMAVMTGSALYYKAALGGKNELCIFNLGRAADTEELARKTKALVEELQQMSEEELGRMLKHLAVFDIRKITASITLLATEVSPPKENKISFKFSQRIAANSFDPSLKRKSLRPSAQDLVWDDEDFFSSEEDEAKPESDAGEGNEETNALVEVIGETEDLNTTWM